MQGNRKEQEKAGPTHKSVKPTAEQIDARSTKEEDDASTRRPPASSNVSKKSCLRLGQLGHWARDCSLQVDNDALKSRCADEDERPFFWSRR